MIDQLNQYTFFKNKKIDSFQRLEKQGYCNENYLLQSENKKYIVRKFIRKDVDRAFEFEVQKMAFHKGIASEPLYLDEEHAFAVSAYLEGSHKDSVDKQDLYQFAEVLNKVHTLKIEKAPIVLDALIETQSTEVQDAFTALESFPSDNVLCHNDLNPRNVLFSETIQLIDWEDAAINDRYFDLASVCVEFDLDQENEAYFLRRYFTNENEINDEKLKAYKVIYKALCTQWFENLENKC